MIDGAIELADLKWALALVEHIVPQTLQQARDNIAESEFERLRNKVIKVIRKKVTTELPGVPARDIYRPLGTTKEYCDKILSTMLASGMLIKVLYKSTGNGRSMELYCLARAEQNPQCQVSP